MRSWTLALLGACAPEPADDPRADAPIDTDVAEEPDTDAPDDDTDVEEPEVDALVGRTWELDVGTVVILEPTGLGDRLEDGLRGRWLLTVTAADAATVDGFVARGVDDGVGQDLCARTADLPTLERVGPYVVTGPLEADVPFGDGIVPVHALSLAATISADGSTLSDASAQGTVDTRALSYLMGSDDPDAVCDYVAYNGDDCSMCPDGGVYCLPMRAERMTLREVNVDLAPIDAPSCAEEVPLCGCATRSPAGGWPALLALLATSGTWARCARTSRSRRP